MRAVETFDVAVVGGGVAGAAAAIALRHGGFSVAVIERGDYSQKRIAEILPPEVRDPLVRLGIWAEFLSLGCRPITSRLSSWGGPRLDVSDYLFNAYGPAWLIVRPGFDRFLATRATERGARLFLNTRITAHFREGRRYWRLTLRENLEESAIRAAFVVMATGRSSSVLRRGRILRTPHDRLIGVTTTIARANSRCTEDTRPMIEAAPEGWWYSVGLPNETISLALMTDADIVRTKVSHYRDRGAMLAALLRNAPHTHERLCGRLDNLTNANIVSANTYLNLGPTDDAILSLGDATSAVDPLAGQGSYVALDAGARAAEAVASYNRVGLAALEDHLRRERARFERHAAERIAYYGLEKRWAHSQFWSRRTALAASLGNTGKP